MRPELISGGNAPKSSTVPSSVLAVDRIARSKDKVVKTSSHSWAPLTQSRLLTDPNL